MNLIRWFRKYNKKILAVTVIIILFGFIGGGTFLQQLSRRRSGLHKPVAHFADNKKITNYDLILAQRELETLEMLQANVLLRSQELSAILLGELLFSQRSVSPALLRQIKQIVVMNGLKISDKQINNIYSRSMPPNVYWLLLTKEAELAGIAVSKEQAGNLLAVIVPKLFNGASYSQLTQTLISNRGLSEQQILNAFSKLLTVLEYARQCCSQEVITSGQLGHLVSWEQEKSDVEFVKFDSAVFAQMQPEPDQQQLIKHFNSYKKFFPDTVTNENPYGFGYRLPEKLQMEYLAVKLDDIAGIVSEVTQQQAEDFYQKNRQRFVEQVPSDPNDPNSPPTEIIKSYYQVADNITNYLFEQRKNAKAIKILHQAKELTDADIEDINTETVKPTTEELEKIASDYSDAAQQLSQQHKVHLYTGRTGMLSAFEMGADEYLGALYLPGPGYQTLSNLSVVPLVKFAFAIEGLGSSELDPFGPAKPKIYKNIGPVKDSLGRIMAIARVTDIQKAVEPQALNMTISRQTLKLNNEADRLESLKTFSLAEKVAWDIKRLTAMDVTKQKAQAFVEQAEKQGWQSTIEKFNDLYGRDIDQNEAEYGSFLEQGEIQNLSEPFELQSPNNIPRISAEAIRTLGIQNQGNPTSRASMALTKKEALLRDLFFSIVPPDSNGIDIMPTVMEFKPDLSYYVIKDISIKRLYNQQFEMVKASRALKQNIIQTNSLMAVHFDPNSILKRLNFKSITPRRKPENVEAQESSSRR
ncbi:MAG: hypothetical protein JXB29_10850 [Sedimentisphaerales bacterium]|nr:hypothetical protein [Sedimentisphaerales bacterium]